MDAKKKKGFIEMFICLELHEQIEVAKQLELIGYTGITLSHFQNYINKIGHDASEFHITKLALTSDQKFTLKRLVGE